MSYPMSDAYKFPGKCEGACDRHVNPIQHVRSGPNMTAPTWDWWYCQEAIREDKSRGFEVIPVADVNHYIFGSSDYE